MDPSHKPSYIAAIVCSWVTFSVNTFFTFFNVVSVVLKADEKTNSSVNINTTSGVNINTTSASVTSGDVPEVSIYSVEGIQNSSETGEPDKDIFPASLGWVLVILLVVYLWQVVWMIYGLTTICRKTSYGFLYVAPGYMHPSVYWCFSGTNLSSVATILLAEFGFKVIALATTVVAMTFVYISLFMSLRRVYIRAPVLIREKKGAEIWLARIFVHNGLASLATWLTYVALFHMAYVLTEMFDVYREIAVTIAVNIIFIEVIVWFFLDNFTWDKFTRYTISPYIISILTLYSILSHSEFSDFSTSNSVMIAFMLITNGLGLILKWIILLVKHVKQPLFTDVGFSARRKNYGTLDYSRLRPESEQKALL